MADRPMYELQRLERLARRQMTVWPRHQLQTVGDGRAGQAGRRLGNANPGAVLKTGVCGFDGLEKPGYQGLIMSGRRPVRVDGKATISGHLSETDLRSVYIGSCIRYAAAGG